MIKIPLKLLATVSLTLGVAVGCATNKPTAEQQAAAQQQQQQANAATTQALSDAQAAISSAQGPCTDTGNAADLLTQAQAAQQAGDNAKAQQLAGQAKQTATDATNSCYQAKDTDLQTQVAGFTNLNADQQARLNEAQQDMSNGQYQAAYGILAALVAELQAAKTTYTVTRGDSLWRIAGKSTVYGNPYEWPLIYKANTDKIKHADLIYPKQAFDVMTNPLKTDVDSAANYAKHRGAWQNHRADKKDRKWASGGN